MKHFVKANTIIPPAPEEPVISDISIARLIDQGLLTLSREIKNLTVLSVSGKLSPADARDLRDHLKLLFELKDREDGNLKGMSDDELKGLAKSALEEPSE